MQPARTRRGPSGASQQAISEPGSFWCQEKEYHFIFSFFKLAPTRTRFQNRFRACTRAMGTGSCWQQVGACLAQAPKLEHGRLTSALPGAGSLVGPRAGTHQVWAAVAKHSHKKQYPRMPTLSKLAGGSYVPVSTRRGQASLRTVPSSSSACGLLWAGAIRTVPICFGGSAHLRKSGREM